jgi:hypothetical protein
MEQKITAFEITDMEGFYKSLTTEAFSDSALIVGKSFFRKNKKDMKIFKRFIIDDKDKLMPTDEYIIDELEKYIFSTSEHVGSSFIMPNDMEYVIGKISNQITYNIMSHLTDNDILEMCFSPTTQDFIWRVKKNNIQ